VPIHLLVEGRLTAAGREPLTFHQVLWVVAPDVESAKARAAEWLAERQETLVGIDDDETRVIPDSQVGLEQRTQLESRGVVAMSGRIIYDPQLSSRRRLLLGGLTVGLVVLAVALARGCR
jgi:hypothetical protein